MTQQPNPGASEDSPVRLSDPEVRAFIDLALRVSGRAAALPSESSPEARAAWEAQQQKAKADAEASFRRELADRLASAYRQGSRNAISKEAQAATNARSYVLYIVVGVLVCMPIGAMVLKLDPQTFGAYLAPISGIAGTIVGYWFGTADRHPPSR